MKLLYSLLALISLSGQLTNTVSAQTLAAPVKATATASADYQITHLEPASWWVGMNNPQLELMVHGHRIAELTPDIQYPGVTIKSVQRVSNPNYLFIQLDITHQALPGKLDINFSRQGIQVLHTGYQLNARREHSAQRKGFSPSDAIYLLVPDRFANGNPANDSVPQLIESSNRTKPGGRHGGDLQGISDHLDYIAQMGFTTIWPTPLTQNNQAAYSYHGYSATDLYQVDARLGSNEDYRQLVSKAKSKGLGFIQDIVLNHIGSGHWWMKDMPSPDWLNFPDKYTETSHARSTVQDPHAAQGDKEKFTSGWFTTTMPDLNQRNSLLATYLIQNTIWWIEYADLSGIRTDTYSYSDKNFLADWSRSVINEYPRLNLVGEEWSNNPAIVAYWQRGKYNPDGYASSMPGMMDFPLHDSLRAGLMGEESTAEGLMKMYLAVANDFVYPDASNLVIFEGNHDTSRLFSALNNSLPHYKIALAYLATMRGIPQFFYGTEMLMQSPKKRDDGKVRSDFPGGWAGDKVSAFTGLGLSKAQKEAQDFMRQLLNWRKTSTAIHQGKLLHYLPENGCYVYFRYTGTQKVMVILNKNNTETHLATSRFFEMLSPTAKGRNVLTGQEIDLKKLLHLPPLSATIIDINEL
ncbi:glycoside hydrolase family 13 protein [Undibacterium sp. RuTC16W]|uniref:glycoside hydrolase family 13 protein n=1 Tax=Undibacterium sp. RuTC16W TaxID=3413048 RepID=UPI003BF29E9D